MATILNLETATTNCSVSIAVDGRTEALKEYNSANYSHSEQLHLFIEDVLEQASLKISDLDAVAVSKGPGSYTGLRIGVSSAKGLCFSLDIPLLSISTLKSMSYQSVGGEVDFIIPLLDARRMEVYAAVFDKNRRQLRETRAEIIDEHSFKAYVQQGKVLLLGSGAEKCKGIVFGEQLVFNTGTVPSAREMGSLSFEKFKLNDFEDVAYFEPYYLKDFMLQGKKK